jgi:hypothetical protein
LMAMSTMSSRSVDSQFGRAQRDSVARRGPAIDVAYHR